ncbi:MAG: pyruvate:ferredoxin (flavodoxin) oxidoreductase [Candidatus Omnitrophica bacterium]|nr:pyruvate:ferredoxin (flavodoxin) oxidoreductase [Candidatus Omnitrophota bacterium]
MSTASLKHNPSKKNQAVTRSHKMIDANEAVAHVAFHTNEVIAIYPITPSSPMGEWADAWQTRAEANLWGVVPAVIEMQSEGGAAGAVHGALQGGALSTTFTASQGLLLMIPNMYKIAGELTPTVFHVAARSLAAQGLSIFGDHSDVMAVRQTGFALLASNSVQEAQDLALIAQAATLESRIPFIHFFDGFRTSHELSKIEMLSCEQMRAMINEEFVAAHRNRGLSPDRPVLRGTAQNPDVYFQARETVNSFYQQCPAIVQKAMDRFAELTGRQYHLYEYEGAADAEHVIIIMGSGAETAREVAEDLISKGEKVGVLKVRLYRPFDTELFLKSLPKTVKKIAVLDRTKEPGSAGDPLYLDVITAFMEKRQSGFAGPAVEPVIVAGRYGLSSKEFTPSMVKGVYDHLKTENPKNHFTVGIDDDVTHTSIASDENYHLELKNVFSGVFYGLGSDGTVGANKNSIKIIGESTGYYAQGYFVYDSKKAGAVTVSHLRFGPNDIRAPYLVEKADIVACHQWNFIDRLDMVKLLKTGGIFLLNSPYSQEETFAKLPKEVQSSLIGKKAKVYAINAYDVAREAGMGNRINTVMQVCFFNISNILDKNVAIEEIKKAIHKTYGKKGEEIVRRNIQAVDLACDHLYEISLPEAADSEYTMTEAISTQAPDFVRSVLGEMAAGRGDQLSVSCLPVDGTYPTGTAKWEKRNLAMEIPVWDEKVCIECGKCAFVCPHGVIRIKAYEEEHLKNAPAGFKSCDARDPAWKGYKYTIQVAPEDCTGCGICVDVCPAKNRQETRLKAINMEPKDPILEQEKSSWDFFLNLPELDRRKINTSAIRQQQVQEPLFEFSSACAGCGETPYLKLMSQLFGDRAVIANATGCSSIYGGNLPTTPWTHNKDGRGPAWSNSLFEDNAEFGLGIRLSLNHQQRYAATLLQKLSDEIGQDLASQILTASQKDEADIYEQRLRVEQLKEKLKKLNGQEAGTLLQMADMLVKKSVWIIGGDGWAYDIGYGGLDHVLASGENVNILVLDTEVYSNTGGQMSKSTPLAAVAKFATGGKPVGKKDLGLIAMTYGNVYVAKVSMGAKDEHTLKAFLEAESYNGPSLIIAYSHCVAHGIQMQTAMNNQKMAVETGQWALFRFDPRRIQTGENPFVLDSRAPRKSLEQYLMMENRFKMLTKSKPEEAKHLFQAAAKNADLRFRLYQHLSEGNLFSDTVSVTLAPPTA